MEKLTKSLLIIGAGREQVPVYQIAKKMGLFIIGTDIDPQAPAFEFADVKLHCSTRNAQETLETVLEYAKVNSIDGVMTVANDVPFTVALVADNLQLSGISLRSAKLVSNKIFMKEQFVRHGIPTPKFDVVNTKDDFFKKVKEKNFPLVLKPSDGRGARGVLFIDENTDISFAWNHSIQNSNNKKLLLEEFIEGDQLSVEGIFLDGKYHSIAFADRNYNNLQLTKPFIVENGGVIPSKYKDKTLDEISKVIENAAHSLEINNGTVKADIVLSENGPMIIEIAARLSGNYLATHHIPMAYGIDIVSAAINMALGIKIKEESLQPKKRNYLCARFFFPQSGIIKSIKGIEEVKSLNYVKMLEIYRKEGEFQPLIDHHAARAGTILCEGSTYEEAVEHTNIAVDHIKFVIE